MDSSPRDALSLPAASSRQRPWRQAAVLVFLAVAAWWLYAHKVGRNMPDFEVYWKAGSRAAAAEPLYREADDDYQLKYFPAFAMMVIPVGALPLPAAKAVWFGTAVVSLVLLLRLGPRVVPEMRRSTGVLVFVALVALGKYYARDLMLGQINIIFAAVATGAVVALGSGREVLGGLFAALAIVIKPYALILLPWIAARRKPPSIIAAGAGVAAALLAPAALYGVNGTVALYKGWWTTVTTTTAGTLLSTDNISVAAMYVKWLGPGAPAWPAIVTSVALLLAAVMVFRGRKGVARPDGLEGALLLAVMPLVSPQGWDYVCVVSTAAIMMLANYFDRLPGLWKPLTVVALAVIGLTLFDLVGRTWMFRLLNLAAITLGFLIVVVALCTLRLRRVA